MCPGHHVARELYFPQQMPGDKTEVEDKQYAFSETVSDWIWREAKDIAKLEAVGCCPSPSRSSGEARTGPGSRLMLKGFLDLHWKPSHTGPPGDPSKGIADDIEVIPQLIHGTSYALGVSENLNTLCVRIVLHSKRALHGLGKFSI